METWEAILVAFGGNAILIAVLAWLAKLMFSEWVKRSTIERQIVFSKLHEKRTDAISNIYLGLTEYVKVCKRFVMSAVHLEEGEREELISVISEETTKFKDIYSHNKLYLKRSICDQIESAFKDTQMPMYQYIFSLGAFVGSNIDNAAHEEEWEKAFISFTTKVPSLLNSLEDEFRKLLGSEEYS